MYTTPYSIMEHVDQAYDFLKEHNTDKDLELALEKSLYISRHPSIKRKIVTLIHDLDWKYNKSRFFSYINRGNR